MIGKLEWYTLVAEKICSDLDSFYAEMYDGIERSDELGGKSGIRINPCPKCGHKDCCTISQDNSLHCFSCGWSGTHINAYISYAIDKLLINRFEALDKLSEWSGLEFPKWSSEEEKKVVMNLYNIQEIRRITVEYYGKQLIECPKSFEYNNNRMTPYQYQTITRKHTPDALKVFNVMFSFDREGLYKILCDKGFTGDQIKESKVMKIPEGLFVYPYYHPIKGDILRFNTKNPFNSTLKNKETGEEVIIRGFSSKDDDDRILGFSPGFSFRKPCLVVEGENDTISSWEAGGRNIIWYGGNIKEHHLKIFEKCEDIIYTAFDNDDTGRKYYNLIQSEYPEKDIRPLDFGAENNDIDEYYKKTTNPLPISVLISKAQIVETSKTKISMVDINTWNIGNRFLRIEFKMNNSKKDGEFIGTATKFKKDLSTGEFEVIKRESNKALSKMGAAFSPYSIQLSDAISAFFDNNIEEKSFDQLLEIFYCSTRKSAIMRYLAKYLLRTDNAQREELSNKMKRALSENDSDLVLKELNDLRNIENANGATASIEPMKIGQHFSLINKDAYFYFNKIKLDGDTPKIIPCMLRNDGEQIRLDLYVSKDKQCLLLLDNKYRLPREVKTVIIESDECSLWEKWADKYTAGEVTDEEINPYTLVEIVKNYIKDYYYFRNDELYYIVALWILGTYCYQLFNSYPYVLITGSKGTGKSTLDKIMYKFSFNGKFAANITESAVYRLVNECSCTLFLDEMEDMSTRDKTFRSGMGAVLKSGYSQTGKVYRTDLEDNIVKGFSTYCPKGISCINGVDDVVEDRCIGIPTYNTAPGLLKGLKQNGELDRNVSKIKDISSRMCLSMLKYYPIIGYITEHLYTSDNMKVHSNRSKEILTPLICMAKFIEAAKLNKLTIEDVKKLDSEGKLEGEYLSKLVSYNDNFILKDRLMVNDATPEEAIKRICCCIANEILESIPRENWTYLNTDNKKYADPIMYNIQEDWFELNMHHIKTFLEEEQVPDVSKKQIAKLVKSAYDIKETRRQTIILENEALIKENDNNKQSKVNAYKFSIQEAISGYDLNRLVEIKKTQAIINSTNILKNDTSVEDIL